LILSASRDPQRTAPETSAAKNPRLAPNAQMTLRPTLLAVRTSRLAAGTQQAVSGDPTPESVEHR